MRALLIAFAALAASSALPSVAPIARAHSGSDALIIVPGDHVNPGEPFEVIASDIGPDQTVQFRVERDDLVILLSSATAAADGHFTTMLTLPADFPAGYANLVGRADDGTEASAWVLVSGRPSTSNDPTWAQPSVVLLGALFATGLALVGFLFLRRLRRG